MLATALRTGNVEPQQTILGIFSRVKLRRALLRCAKNFSEKVALRPDDAVNRLAGCTTDCADGKTPGYWFRVAVVTLGLSAFDDLDLSIVASRPTLNKRYVCGETHPVDMFPSIQIVERVKDNVETLEPLDVKLRIFDVCVKRFKFDVGIELSSCLFGDLESSGVNTSSNMIPQA